MTRSARRFDDFMNRTFAPFRDVSGEHVNAACGHVLDDLRDGSARASAHAAPDLVLAQPPFLAASSLKRTSRWIQFAGAAVLVLAAAVGSTIEWRRADSSLYRVIEGAARLGDTIQANSGAAAILALADGSRVEMRSQSELSLERTDDGLRIRLDSGSIIVNAAKQSGGHLYVQTKDVTVSVVGTVFLVSAEPQGSRVAVIEGEVRVQLGTTEKKLLPGEQVATNPAMASAPVIEEIAWSRNVDEHVARLQQIAPATQLPSPVGAREPRDVFEAATIRLAAPLFPSGGRIGGPEPPPQARPPVPGALLCIGGELQIDPRRFAVSPMSLQGLIGLAYGRTCQSMEQLVGGPDWVRIDGYNVEAVIPVGTPGYTGRQLRNGAAPKLQAMLQSLLADRFRLVLRREMREMAAYNLVLVTEGKLTPATETRERVILQFPVNGPPPGPSFRMAGTTLARFAETLPMYTGRPVIDKTGLNGVFDIVLEFPELAGCCTGGTDPRPLVAEQLPRRLQEQIGLRLEPTRGQVEVLVIERVERPTEN